MKKTRVLQVCGGLSPEGIGVFLLNTVEHIDKNRYEITFGLATKYPQLYESRVKAAGGKIIRTHDIGDGLKGKIWHFLNLIRILKKDGPFDVVHSHMDFFNGINLLAAFIGGVQKRISHAHIAKKPQISLTEKLYYFTMKIMIKLFSTDRVGCSKVANENVNGQGQVIFNGIDLQKFAIEKRFPQDIARDDTKMNIITVGRMDDQKNPFFIINTIKQLSLLNKDFHFYWLGSGSLEFEIKRFAEKMKIANYITFLKNRTDVAEIMHHMDMFIFPSLYEGLGIVLIEAQASNLPCYVSMAVTREVDLGLCTYLDLRLGEKRWAEEINNFHKNSSDIPGIDINRSKEFDVSYMVGKLQTLYSAI